MPYILGAGFADSKMLESMPILTRRGKLFLQIASRFLAEDPDAISPELGYILKKLQPEPRAFDRTNSAEDEEDNFASFVMHLHAAKQFGVRYEDLTFEWLDRDWRSHVKESHSEN
ncbi:MAG: hypothetical protein IPL39_13435 [Opitutaceae bacterium]|nr:hypothetical protein [Opitutaceae bacterium]